MTNRLRAFLCASLPLFAHAQLSINAIGTTYNVDLSSYEAAGFQPGGGAGTLDSDVWSAEGFSTGGVDFGGTALTGDLARGIAVMGTETTGGIYALTDPAPTRIWIQPTTDDFTPGSLTMRLENNTAVTIGELNIQYTASAFNDEDRSNTLSCAYSTDNITYTAVAGLSFISPELQDDVLYENILSATQTGLAVAPGELIYLRWTGNDTSGAGSRDEFGIGNISFSAAELIVLPAYTFSDSAIAVPESAGATFFEISLSESADCVLSLGYDPASTATPAFDYGLTDFSVEFTAGGPTTATIDVGIVDDLTTEVTETGIIYVTDVTGTCVAGGIAAITIYIEDNDAIVPPVASFTTVGVTADESVGSVSGAISLSESDDCTLQMYLDVASTMENGLDYSFLLPTFITFTAGGPTEVTFDIPIIDDLDIEPSEMLLMNIIPWTGTCIVSGIADYEIWIEDNDVASIPNVSFVVESDTKNEDAGAANTTIILSESADCSIEITAAAASTAVNGLDYSVILPAEFTFTAGGTTAQTLIATIINDLEVEPSETIIFEMSVTGGTCLTGDITTHTITITDNDFVGIHGTSAPSICVVPNPSSDYISISTGSRIFRSTISDLSGATLLTLDGTMTTIDIADMPAGIYILRAETETGMMHTTFVKQ